MSLRSQIKRATRHSLRAQKSLRELVTVKIRGEEETYDAADDSTTSAGDVDLTKIPAYFTSYEDEEIDGSTIQKKDQRCEIEIRHLKGYRPENNDLIVRTGKNAGDWEIMGTKYPPADAIVILQVRGQ